MKVCSSCNKEKEFKEFYKNRTTTSGYNSQCKNCMMDVKYGKAPRKTSYHQDPIIDNEKLCTKCRKIKPISEFWTDNRRWNKLESRCTECSSGAFTAENFKNFTSLQKHSRENLF